MIKKGNKRLTVTLSEEEIEKLKKLCVELGYTNLSYGLRFLIHFYFDIYLNRVSV